MIITLSGTSEMKRTTCLPLITTLPQNPTFFTVHHEDLRTLNNSLPVLIEQPISIAELSEASTVFGRSNVQIAGSNLVRGMDAFLCVVLSCV